MFSKKIIVLKQTAEGYNSGAKSVCGICRMEKENDVLTVYLSLMGFAALTYGAYRLYVIADDKTVLKKELGRLPASCAFNLESELSLNGGVSAGIWVVKDDIPLMVAYQKSDGSRLSVREYSACVVNDLIAERKLREREKEFAVSKEPPAPQSTEKAETREVAASEINGELPPLTAYDDEAVATENYYDNDDEIRKKLLNLKELDDEYVRRESDDDYRLRPQKNDQSQKDFGAYENETNDKGSQKDPYYISVKSELEGIFSRFPEEPALGKTFADSRWAKVHYADEKFYVVGVIKENGKEKYICYGVPSPYRETPPKELAGYCSFVPISVFDLKGDGYFMMFQDAVTGKCVKKG